MSEEKGMMRGNGSGIIKSESPEIFSDDLPAIQGMTAQKIQTRYMTAVEVQIPRDLDKIVDAVLREAEHAAESFFYAWGEGKNHVEGGSIGLAACMAREWGNCAVETDIQETQDAYMFTSHFIDLEKGFTMSRSMRQAKQSIIYGKMDEFRKDKSRFQIGQSISIRNVVFASMPLWLKEQAIERAKDSVRKGITKEGIATATEKAFKVLSQHSITEDRVLLKLGRKNKHEITMEDIIDLRTAYSAISKGEAYADKVFPPSQVGHAAGSKAEAPVIPIGKGKEDPPEKKGEKKSDPAPEPGSEASGKSTGKKKDSLSKLLDEGKKILGKERFEAILTENFPDIPSVSKLNKAQKIELLKVINEEVDSMEE